MKKFIFNSEKELKEFASNLSKNFSSGTIALYGDLGAGKTTFVQGFAKALGIKDRIISPTFVLIRQHLIPKTKNNLYHIDVYRLDNDSSYRALGIEDVLSNPSNLVLIEWAEKVENYLPKNVMRIRINKINSTQRELTIDA